MNESPLTDQSRAGTYYVITVSRSLFEVILDPDVPPLITRYRAGANVGLHDGEPLTGVSEFTFDALTGEGVVYWWKDDPEERDGPDAPYVGSVRRTSTVRLILRDDSGVESIGPASPPAEWPQELIRHILDEDGGSLLDRFRLGLSVTAHALFEEFIAAVVTEHGRER